MKISAKIAGKWTDVPVSAWVVGRMLEAFAKKESHTFSWVVLMDGRQVHGTINIDGSVLGAGVMVDGVLAEVRPISKQFIAALRI